MISITYSKCLHKGRKAVKIESIEGHCLSYDELPEGYVAGDCFFYAEKDYIRVGSYTSTSENFKVGGIILYSTWKTMLDIMKNAVERLSKIKKEQKEWLEKDPINKIIL